MRPSKASTRHSGGVGVELKCLGAAALAVIVAIVDEGL